MLEVENRLMEMIALCGDCIDVACIGEDTDLVRDFGFDSINIVKLVVEVECAFGIEIKEEDLQLEKLSKYKLLLQIIKKGINENSYDN